MRPSPKKLREGVGAKALGPESLCPGGAVATEMAWRSSSSQGGALREIVNAFLWPGVRRIYLKCSLKQILPSAGIFSYPVSSSGLGRGTEPSVFAG